MHRAIQRHGLSSFLKQEAPFLVAAFMIAELFYKFGSFALECGAFLATWYLLSLAASLAASRLFRRPQPDAER